MVNYTDNFLFYDTETTGLFKKNHPISYSGNPYIMQLAAALTDGLGNILETLDVLIKPEGYTADKIHPKALEAHGITFEKAQDTGIARKEALDLFGGLLSRTTKMVAHNNEFDLKMLSFDYYREKRDAREFQEKIHYCTMAMGKPILDLPPTDSMLKWGFTGPKPPNLQELYMHFHGKKFEGAHNAFNDLNAMIPCFFKMFSKGL